MWNSSNSLLRKGKVEFRCVISVTKSAINHHYISMNNSIPEPGNWQSGLWREYNICRSSRFCLYFSSLMSYLFIYLFLKMMLRWVFPFSSVNTEVPKVFTYLFTYWLIDVMYCALTWLHMIWYPLFLLDTIRAKTV